MLNTTTMLKTFMGVGIKNLKIGVTTPTFRLDPISQELSDQFQPNLVCEITQPFLSHTVKMAEIVQRP